MPAIQRRLRYADLVQLGLFKNRQSLKNAVDNYGFPRGALTGENSRTWGEGEVQDWIDSRPVKSKPTPNPKRRRGRPRKAQPEQELQVSE
jgi:hypothetical protein